MAREQGDRAAIRRDHHHFGLHRDGAKRGPRRCEEHHRHPVGQKEGAPHEICGGGYDGVQMRMAMQEDGYIETEVNPIEKIECYFEEWDKTVMTPVSGLFDYTDQNGTWVASIDFGDGTCDEWVTKTWDVNVFPDHPEGSEDFSVFKY